MPTKIEDIIADFCALTKRKKAAQYSDYQTQVQKAYKGERVFQLPINGRGLEEEGGRLLGWFFEQYPWIEEVHLQDNMINEYDGRRLTSGIGFDALINSLTYLKKLRVLDLSGDKYTPEQLEKLAKNVLMNHASFTTLKLSTAYITDAHLEAMIPYLSCPKLKTLSLNGNDRHLTGESGVFERLTDKLLSDCPSIHFIDVSGNTAIKADGLAAKALMRLVMTNQKVFVRIPQDKTVYEQAMKNHYERFIPSQFALMDMEHNKMQTQFEEFKAHIEALLGLIITIRAHEVRFTQVDVRIDEVEARNARVQQQIQEAINLQCLKQILIEKQIAIMHAYVREFRADIHSTKERVTSTEAHVAELESRTEGFEVSVGHITENMRVIRGNIARQADAIENLDERMEQKLRDFRVLFNTLENRMQERWTMLTTNMPDDINPNLSKAEQAYTKKFKYLLVQMHIVSMTAMEGTMQLGASNTASMALIVLNIVSSMAPGPLGTPLQAVFGYLFQTMDEKNTRQRMEQITQLGAEPADIARLANALSQRLIHCLTLEHYVKKGSLSKLLSITEDITRSFTENGFYGALFYAVQDTSALTPLHTAVKHALTIPELEKRAEQDAKLLLAAVVKEGVPKNGDMPTIDTNRLFLYAAPMLTMVDRLFLSILQKFCTDERCELSQTSIKAEKRQQFYGRVAKSWHAHADDVSAQIENTPDEFVEKLASSYSTKKHTDGTTGVFYFKSQTIFQMNQKRHVSMRNQALEVRDIEETLECALHL